MSYAVFVLFLEGNQRDETVVSGAVIFQHEDEQ